MKILILKDLKLKGINNQKIIINYVIINRKNFYYQPIDSNIKPFEEMRKLTTGQGEDYTTGCSDYDYIKNQINSNWFKQKKKELDANPKAIQQIEFVGQLKKLYNNNNNIMLIMLNLCLF